jgi:hypothetical protein
MHSNQPRHRGIALVIVLCMVVLVAAAVAFAIQVAGKDVRDNGKQIHNLTIQDVTEGAMQQARAFFSTTATMKQWNTYLALPYPTSPIGSAATTLKSTHSELFPAVPTGFTCFMYARDDADELPPAANDPTHDNNQTIYIGALCTGPNNSTAELSGVLTFDNSRFKYSAGGASGNGGVSSL